MRPYSDSAKREVRLRAGVWSVERTELLDQDLSDHTFKIDIYCNGEETEVPH